MTNSRVQSSQLSDDVILIIENIGEGLTINATTMNGTVLEGVCAVFGAPNNNRRVYEKEEYLPHLSYLKEKIEKRRSQLEAQKNKIINQVSVRNEKEKMRLKILIGTGILEDLQDTLETNRDAYSVKMTALKLILNATIENKSNRDFLKQYDYI